MPNKNMSEKIYVIGHKSPDLDSVTAAIAYANFKNELEKTDRYLPAVAGKINQVTEFILNKFNFSKPEILTSANGQNLILVDHNEASQIVDGYEEAKIVEILDHHKMNFSYGEPIKIQVLPLGSSNSIIFQEYKKNNIEINKNLAGLMLSAVLDDTVITKSPTCTEIDREIIIELANLSGIENWKEYGLEMFKVKSSISKLSAEEIVKLDFKDFSFKAGKFGIGQVETVDLSEVENRSEELLAAINKIKSEGVYHSVVLFATDIINEGSKVLLATDDEASMEKALGNKLENNMTYAAGVISRKKQVIPMFSLVFDK